MRHGLGPRPFFLLLIAVTLAHLAVLLLWHIEQAKPPRPIALQVAMTDPSPPGSATRPRPARSAPASATLRDTPPVQDAAPAWSAPETTVRSADTPAPATNSNPESRTVPAKNTDSIAAPVIQTAPSYQAAHLGNRAAEYPALAQRRGWQGRVVLKVLVQSNGRAGEITVHTSSGHTMLDEAAIDAVRQWRFVPARRGETAISDWSLVPIEFKLRDE